MNWTELMTTTGAGSCIVLGLALALVIRGLWNDGGGGDPQ